MTRFVTGAQLHPEDRRRVLSAYVHRFTGDHTPQWARKPRPSGEAYEVQFADDNDWLANTRFAVTAKGGLDKRVRHCESNPTWPNRRTAA